MINYAGLEKINNKNSKIIIINRTGIKNSFFTILIMLFFILLIFIATRNINNPEITVNENITMLLKSTFIFGVIFSFCFCYIYPLKIILEKKANGNLYVYKRDWFFITKEFNIMKSQNAVFLARKKYWVGNTISFGSDIYRPLIRFQDATKNKEINLTFSAAYFMRHGGFQEKYSKEQSQNIADFLEMQLVIEE